MEGSRASTDIPQSSARWMRRSSRGSAEPAACATCMRAKLRGTPARKVQEQDHEILKLAKEACDVGHSDTVKIRAPDHLGRTRWLLVNDQKSKRRRGMAMPDKSSDTTWNAYQQMLPGSRQETSPARRRLACAMVQAGD